MAGQIIFLGIAAICLMVGGFVGGLTLSAYECGAGRHCAPGASTCVALLVIGLACLIAGAVA